MVVNVQKEERQDVWGLKVDPEAVQTYLTHISKEACRVAVKGEQSSEVLTFLRVAVKIFVGTDKAKLRDAQAENDSRK